VVDILAVAAAVAVVRFLQRPLPLSVVHPSVVSAAVSLICR
jgi:hypothetical protein